MNRSRKCLCDRLWVSPGHFVINHCPCSDEGFDDGIGVAATYKNDYWNGSDSDLNAITCLRLRSHSQQLLPRTTQLGCEEGGEDSHPRPRAPYRRRGCHCQSPPTGSAKP